MHATGQAGAVPLHCLSESCCRVPHLRLFDVRMLPSLLKVHMWEVRLAPGGSCTTPLSDVVCTLHCIVFFGTCWSLGYGLTSMLRVVFLTPGVSGAVSLSVVGGRLNGIAISAHVECVLYLHTILSWTIVLQCSALGPPRRGCRMRTREVACSSRFALCFSV